MSLGDIAAKLPWPVFACGNDKRPVVATGFKAATREIAAILAQFNRPGAEMIGVPTGSASGFVVIDIDIKTDKDGRLWLRENSEALPPTRTHRTQSGGLHLLFYPPAGVEIRNSASKIAPGVDVRGEGGYVIIPPSPGYAVADDSEIADMPRWLVRACMRPDPAPPPTNRPAEIHERYIQAAIDGEVLAAARAAEGTRNDTLHRAAVKLGTLVGAGKLSRAAAETELQRAGQAAGLPPRECAQTIKSGLDFGSLHPRDPPEPRINGYHGHPPEFDEPGRFGPEPEDEPYCNGQDHTETERPPSPFPATPLNADELNDIPPRELVYGHFLFKKFISAIGAQGGAGKTAYACVVAAAVASGRDLLDETVHESGAVWIYNLEDPRVELLRRIKAVIVGHKIKWSEIDGRVFLDSGRDRPLIIAHQKVGLLIAWPQISALIEEIKARNVKLLIIDPFVRSHKVEENYNDQIDFVASLWAEVADKADCAILLVHHFKKGGLSGDASAFRGATALIDASRAAVTLATMSAEEAQEMGIAEKERWQYIRVDNAKLNLAPPPENATWLKLEGIDLHNGTAGRKSDNVQTVQRWKQKKINPIKTLQPFELNAILDIIQQGPEPGVWFTANRRGGSGRWAGNIITQRHELSASQAAEIIAAWLKTGLLIEANYMHPEWRRLVPGVQVDNTKRPT